MAQIHSICVPQTRGVDELGGGTIAYIVSFPRLFQDVKCPLPGCPAVAHSYGQLQEHFMYRHFW